MAIEASIRAALPFILPLARRVAKPCPVDPSATPLASFCSPQRTALKRLSSSGSTLLERIERIAVLDETTTIPNDLGGIEEAVCKVRAKLLIIDPLMAFLGRDANSDQKVRRALAPLKQFAERNNISVLMVRHLNKRGGGGKRCIEGEVALGSLPP